MAYYIDIDGRIRDSNGSYLPQHDINNMDPFDAANLQSYEDNFPSPVYGDSAGNYYNDSSNQGGGGGGGSGSSKPGLLTYGSPVDYTAQYAKDAASIQAMRERNAAMQQTNMGRQAYGANAEEKRSAFAKMQEDPFRAYQQTYTGTYPSITMGNSQQAYNPYMPTQTEQPKPATNYYNPYNPADQSGLMSDFYTAPGTAYPNAPTYQSPTQQTQTKPATNYYNPYNPADQSGLLSDFYTAPGSAYTAPVISKPITNNSSGGTGYYNPYNPSDQSGLLADFFTAPGSYYTKG